MNGQIHKKRFRRAPDALRGVALIQLAGLITLLVQGGVGCSAHADTVVSIYTATGDQTSGSVMPGGTIDLAVRLVTDDPVVGLRYDVLLPADDWSLTGRDYGTYGWLVEDGFFDASVPLETATFPVTVNNDLYDAGGSPAPDFHFETARSDYNPLSAGTWTAEQFDLQVALDAPLGEYSISLLNLHAYDSEGDPIAIAAGEAFDLDVVPEPGTAAMVLVGIGALGLLRARRRMR